MAIKRNNCRGFTLIEMVIAIAIFGVISTLAYTGLTTVVRTQKGTEKVTDRLNELQKAMMFLQRDVEQAIPRSVRDDAGFRVDAMIGGGGTSDVLLTLTRAGWHNPAKRKRSNLQRITYRLKDEEDGTKSLVRENYFHLDQSNFEEPTEFVILSNLETADIEFFTANGQPTNSWPQASSGFNQNSEPPPALPTALEIKLTLNDWGEINRLFRVSDGL